MHKHFHTKPDIIRRLTNWIIWHYCIELLKALYSYEWKPLYISWMIKDRISRPKSKIVHEKNIKINFYGWGNKITYIKKLNPFFRFFFIFFKQIKSIFINSLLFYWTKNFISLFLWFKTPIFQRCFVPMMFVLYSLFHINATLHLFLLLMYAIST